MMAVIGGGHGDGGAHHARAVDHKGRHHSLQALAALDIDHMQSWQGRW
jgi:hypothetical protein